jgi:hypothetical protein
MSVTADFEAWVVSIVEVAQELSSPPVSTNNANITACLFMIIPPSGVEAKPAMITRVKK